MNLYPLAPFRENKPTYTGCRPKQFREKVVYKTIHCLAFPRPVYTRETAGEVKKNGYSVLPAPGQLSSKDHKSIVIKTYLTIVLLPLLISRVHAILTAA